jgi:hypothetical protein
MDSDLLFCLCIGKAFELLVWYDYRILLSQDPVTIGDGQPGREFSPAWVFHLHRLMCLAQRNRYR